MKEKYNIIDILEAGINLEPTYCRKCGKNAFFNFGLKSVICENCGFIDDGGKEIKEV